jgi:hypothetical protein
LTGFAHILEDLNEAEVRYVLKWAVGRERDLADLEVVHGELP